MTSHNEPCRLGLDMFGLSVALLCLSLSGCTYLVGLPTSAGETVVEWPCLSSNGCDAYFREIEQVMGSNGEVPLRTALLMAGATTDLVLQPRSDYAWHVQALKYGMRADWTAAAWAAALAQELAPTAERKRLLGIFQKEATARPVFWPALESHSWDGTQPLRCTQGQYWRVEGVNAKFDGDTPAIQVDGCVLAIANSHITAPHALRQQGGLVVTLYTTFEYTAPANGSPKGGLFIDSGGELMMQGGEVRGIDVPAAQREHGRPRLSAMTADFRDVSFENVELTLSNGSVAVRGASFSGSNIEVGSTILVDLDGVKARNAPTNFLSIVSMGQWVRLRQCDIQVEKGIWMAGSGMAPTLDLQGGRIAGTEYAIDGPANFKPNNVGAEVVGAVQ